MVEAGLGVALVPRDSAASSKAQNVRLIPLQHTVEIELAAIWRTDDPSPVESLVDSAAAAVADAVEGRPDITRELHQSLGP